MIGERKQTSQQNYGTLVMRPYNIAGNSINAFYDSDDNLVFVLDKTITNLKTNVLLVINPESDKKWDEILSTDYNVDLETIRPKQDNKYQKLDIEYSGLGVYDNLIQAYVSGDNVEDALVQLNVLRDSAARHSAMVRLDVANDIISKTNVTIIRTKETIVKLQVRVKTLREKLSETKKEIGKVSTKQSAAKILKLESQIDATNEKLKRAKKRLESAQRRLESATVDAELASEVLNQPALEITQNKPVVVAPKHELQTVVQEEDKEDDSDIDDEIDYDDEDDDEKDEDNDTEDEPENDVKPLLSEDPNILNDNIAFKPISFDAPSVSEEVKEEQNIPVLNQDVFDNTTTEEDVQLPVIENVEPVLPVIEEKPVDLEPKPVLESMTPVAHEEEEIEKTVDEEPFVAPVVPISPVESEPEVPAATAPVSPLSPVPQTPPVPPIVNKNVGQIDQVKTNNSRPSFVYYVLLFILILLSVFTLWLYQKNVKTSEPILTAKTEETVVVEESAEKQPIQQPVQESVTPDVTDEDVFFDEEEPVVEENTTNTTEEVEEQPEETVEEVVVQENTVPVVMDDVPARVVTSGPTEEDEIVDNVVSEQDVVKNKPVYEPGNRRDDMFVSDDYYDASQSGTETEEDENLYNPFFEE